MPTVRLDTESVLFARTSGQLVVQTTLLLLAVLAPWITPYEANRQVAASLLPPSAPHPMGTDNIGRDLFSLVIAGSRASLAIGVSAALAALLVGVSPWSQSTMWKQSMGVAWLNAMVHELRPLFLNDVPQHPSA